MQDERQNGVTLQQILASLGGLCWGFRAIRPVAHLPNLCCPATACPKHVTPHDGQRKCNTELKLKIKRGAWIMGLPFQDSLHSCSTTPRLCSHFFLSTSWSAWAMQERDHNALSRGVRWKLRKQDYLGIPDAYLTAVILSALGRARKNHYNPHLSSCHIKRCDSYCATCDSYCVTCFLSD